MFLFGPAAKKKNNPPTKTNSTNKQPPPPTIQITSEKNKQECAWPAHFIPLPVKNVKAKIPVFCVSLQALAPYVCRQLTCIIQSGFCGFRDYNFSTKLSTHQEGVFETLNTASSSPVSLGFLNLNLKPLWLEPSCSSPLSSEGGEHHLSHWHQN